MSVTSPFPKDATADDIDRQILIKVQQKLGILTLSGNDLTEKQTYLDILKEYIKQKTISDEQKIQLSTHLFFASPNHILKKERHFFRKKSHSNQTRSMHKIAALLGTVVGPLTKPSTVPHITLKRHIEVFEEERILFRPILLTPQEENDIVVSETSLGAGGCAKVFEGTYGGQQVAVKINYKENAVNNTQIEVSALTYLTNNTIGGNAKLLSNNVISLIAYSSSFSTMVFPLAKSDLTTYYKTTYPDSESLMPPVQQMKLLQDVVHGVHFLHKNDVIHRDMKPENVLVMEESDGQTKAVITDFGLAITPNTEERIGFCGTPPYVAPEIFDFSNKENSSEARNSCKPSDVLGVWHILILLVTGKCSPDFFNSPPSHIIMQMITSSPLKYFQPLTSKVTDALKSNSLYSTTQRATFSKLATEIPVVDPKQRPTIEKVEEMLITPVTPQRSQ